MFQFCTRPLPHPVSTILLTPGPSSLLFPHRSELLSASPLCTCCFLWLVHFTVSPWFLCVINVSTQTLAPQTGLACTVPSLTLCHTSCFTVFLHHRLFQMILLIYLTVCLLLVSSTRTWASRGQESYLASLLFWTQCLEECRAHSRVLMILCQMNKCTVQADTPQHRVHLSLLTGHLAQCLSHR